MHTLVARSVGGGTRTFHGDNMATFQAKSDRGEVITIIQKISTRRAGSFDDGSAKVQGLATFVRSDNHNAMNANHDFTEFTDVRTKVVYRRV
jgi:hypothetical protein